jgi:thioredoxin 1
MKKWDRFRNLAAILMLFALLALVSLIPDEENTVIAAVKPVVKKATTIKKTKAKKKSTKDIKTLEDALKAGVPVIVKLGSDNCIPCRAMNPVIKGLAEEQDGKAVFMALDVYENRELARQAEVRVIPTILFYDKHGKPKGKSEGGMSKEQLLKAIKEMELNK